MGVCGIIGFFIAVLVILSKLTRLQVLKGILELEVFTVQ